jgi:hypothetical protein
MNMAQEIRQMWLNRTLAVLAELMANNTSSDELAKFLDVARRTVDLMATPAWIAKVEA